jgi:hypothetical protein
MNDFELVQFKSDTDPESIKHTSKTISVLNQFVYVTFDGTDLLFKISEAK